MPLLYCKEEEVSGIFANRVSFCGFPFYGTARKVSKNDGWCGLRRKWKDLELGIISMVQEGIFLADCTNINGGACHMRTKCTFFSNAAEPTLWYHDSISAHMQESAPKNCWDDASAAETKKKFCSICSISEKIITFIRWVIEINTVTTNVKYEFWLEKN